MGAPLHATIVSPYDALGVPQVSGMLPVTGGLVSSPGQQLLLQLPPEPSQISKQSGLPVRLVFGLGIAQVSPRRTTADQDGINPRPDSVFRHLRPDSGGCATPLGVSKGSVVKLREKAEKILKSVQKSTKLFPFFFATI